MVLNKVLFVLDCFSTSHSIHSAHDQVGSPFSGSRSDLMLDDIDSNVEQLKVSAFLTPTSKFRLTRAGNVVGVYRNVTKFL